MSFIHVHVIFLEINAGSSRRKSTRLSAVCFFHHFSLNSFPGLRKNVDNLQETRYTLDRRPWHEMGFSAKKTQCFLTFLILHCSKLLRSSTSQPFFPHCFKNCFSSSNKAMGVIGPRLCLKTHWFTIALTSSDIRVCPATLEVAFTCCGHQSFFSERHALSIIWVPAREVPFFLFNNFACKLFSLMGYSFNPKASFCSHRFPSNISIWIYHRCAFPNYSIQQLGLNNLSFGFCRRSPWLHTLGTRACADWITIYYMWEFLLVRSGIIFKCIEGFIATQLCGIIEQKTRISKKSFWMFLFRLI